MDISEWKLCICVTQSSPIAPGRRKGRLRACPRLHRQNGRLGYLGDCPARHRCEFPHTSGAVSFAIMDANFSAKDAAQTRPLKLRRILAWGVHLFTASGAVWGLFALFEIMQGDFGRATIFMLVALGVDSMDGSLARRVDVSEYAPSIDGRRMDDIVDYLNFVIVPCVFMAQSGSVLSPAWVALPALASAFGFSQKDAKTDDNFFLGWPSYWNVLAFYLWLLDLSPAAGTLWVVGLSIAIFIPYKYIYPSQLENRALRYFVSYTGLVWAIALAWAALDYETASSYHVVEVSLVYPVLYLALSFKLGGFHRS